MALKPLCPLACSEPNDRIEADILKIRFGPRSLFVSKTELAKPSNISPDHRSSQTFSAQAPEQKFFDALGLNITTLKNCQYITQTYTLIGNVFIYYGLSVLIFHLLCVIRAKDSLTVHFSSHPFFKKKGGGGWVFPNLGSIKDIYSLHILSSHC